ncbi:hypothetical protein [Flagellimonas sp.]|uniref:hypothetical protein n=1 Tax=Flagellimonas sp. TaxID=2058762 RepID=UPI003F4A7952
MKKNIIPSVLLVLALYGLSSWTEAETSEDLTANFTYGDPEIGSINALSFGPDGILFVGDSKNAMVYALDTKDIDEKANGAEINISKFDEMVASSLGTTADKISIGDMAVNPKSKTPYFAVSMEDGATVLLRMNGEALENVSLKEISYSKISLADPIAVDAKSKRDRPLRVWAIADLKFHGDRILVSGLSNKEFASTFRSIPFPFTDSQDQTSLEIWHAAHGKYETHAPIKTFDVVSLNNQDYLMASYTCTPLVLFPMSELENGKHIKGRTVAELGAGNSPLDMISYEKEGKQYFLMSNSNRPVMRLDYEDIANFKETLTEPVTEFYVSTGVPYDNLPFPYVQQMDNLDDTHVLYIQRTGNGELVLRSRPTKWM